MHDAVAHVHTEPLNFTGKFSVQYNIHFITLIMDFCELEVGVILVISIKRRAVPYAGTCLYVNVFKMLEECCLCTVCSGCVAIKVKLVHEVDFTATTTTVLETMKLNMQRSMFIQLLIDINFVFLSLHHLKCDYLNSSMTLISPPAAIKLCLWHNVLTERTVGKIKIK